MIKSLISLRKKTFKFQNSDLLRSKLGFLADVYKPIYNKTIYSEDGSGYIYAASPDITDNFYFSGIFERGRSAKNELDPYENPETYIFVPEEIELPINSKIVIHVESDFFLVFKVKERTTRFKEERKYLLIPFEEHLQTF